MMKNIYGVLRKTKKEIKRAEGVIGYLKDTLEGETKFGRLLKKCDNDEKATGYAHEVRKGLHKLLERLENDFEKKNLERLLDVLEEYFDWMAATLRRGHIFQFFDKTHSFMGKIGKGFENSKAANLFVHLGTTYSFLTGRHVRTLLHTAENIDLVKGSKEIRNFSSGSKEIYKLTRKLNDESNEIRKLVKDSKKEIKNVAKAARKSAESIQDLFLKK